MCEVAKKKFLRDLYMESERSSRFKIKIIRQHYNGEEKESKESEEVVQEDLNFSPLSENHPAWRGGFLFCQQKSKSVSYHIRPDMIRDALHRQLRIRYNNGTMKVEITAKNLALTPSLTAYIEQKLGGLEKFLKRVDLEESGELELKAVIARTTAHHHKGEVFQASADLLLPRRNLRAKESHEDVHAAIDRVRNALKIEIQKYKEK